MAWAQAATTDDPAEQAAAASADWTRAIVSLLQASAAPPIQSIDEGLADDLRDVGAGARALSSLLARYEAYVRLRGDPLAVPAGSTVATITFENQRTYAMYIRLRSGTAARTYDGKVDTGLWLHPGRRDFRFPASMADIGAAGQYKYPLWIDQEQRLPGDADGDGEVSVLDLAALDTAATAGSRDPLLDLDGSGYVDRTDIKIAEGYLGKQLPVKPLGMNRAVVRHMVFAPTTADISDAPASQPAGSP